MLTVDGALYKDVNQQDFSHYFANTVMAWKLSPTKRRVVVIGGCEGGKIKGSYLTRDGEFKDKEFSFFNWWDSLSALPLQTLMFNISNGAAVWNHKLQKNLRKSFPWAINAVHFYGNVGLGEKTSQNVLKHAFGELYGVQQRVPTLKYALEHGDTTVTQERFLLDREKGRLYYHRQFIGNTKGNRVLIPNTKKVLVKLLGNFGVLEDQIDDAPPKHEAPLGAAPVHMKFNPDYVDSYSPAGWEGAWYSVMMQQDPVGLAPKIRTYKGVYPGPNSLLPGWQVHNYGIN